MAQYVQAPEVEMQDPPSRLCDHCLLEPAFRGEPVPGSELSPSELAEILGGKPWPITWRCRLCHNYYLRSGRRYDRPRSSIERQQRQRDRAAVCRMLGIEQKPKRRPGRKPWWMAA